MTYHHHLLRSYDSDDEVEPISPSSGPPPQTKGPEGLSNPVDYTIDPDPVTGKTPIDSSNLDEKESAYIPILVASPIEPQTSEQSESSLEDYGLD